MKFLTFGALILLGTVCVKVQGNIPAHEEDFLWEKYGDLRADLEELKAKFLHLAEFLKITDVKTGTPTKQIHVGTTSSTNTGEIPFKIHLEYASMSLLENNTVQYMVELSSDDTSDIHCNFSADTMVILKNSIEKSKNKNRAILVTEGVANYLSFNCEENNSRTGVRYKFLPFVSTASLKSPYLAKSFDEPDCSLSYPVHSSNGTFDIVKVIASCKNFAIINTTIDDIYLSGWSIRGDDLRPLDRKIVSRKISYTNNGIEAQFSTPASAHLHSSDVLSFSLCTYIQDENSPIENQCHIYWHTRSFDNTMPPIKNGDLGVHIVSYLEENFRIRKGFNYTLRCFAGGSPRPSVLLSHNKRFSRSKDEQPRIFWQSIINSVKMEITNADADDEGEYVCEGSSGNKLVRKVQNVTLCDIPLVNFTFNQNSSAVQASIQSEFQNKSGDNFDKIYYISCYNSTDMSQYKNHISTQYDTYYYHKIVDVREDIDWDHYNVNIVWIRRPGVVIPKKIYCSISSPCGYDMKQFDLNI